MTLCHVTSHFIQEPLEAFFKKSSQDGIDQIRLTRSPFAIIFYPTLTLVLDYYICVFKVVVPIAMNKIAVLANHQAVKAQTSLCI